MRHIIRVAVQYETYAVLERLNTRIGDSVSLEAQIWFLLILRGLENSQVFNVTGNRY
jgi:hypothetical protein